MIYYNDSEINKLNHKRIYVLGKLNDLFNYVKEEKTKENKETLNEILNETLKLIKLMNCKN